MGSLWEVNTVHGSSWHRTDTARKFRVRRRARRNQSPTVVLSGSIRSGGCVWRGGVRGGQEEEKQRQHYVGCKGQKGSREEGQAGPWQRQDQKRHRWEGLGWLGCGQRRVREETGGRGGWSGAGAGGGILRVMLKGESLELRREGPESPRRDNAG